MKKNLALIISVLLIISLFAGCGGSSMSADSAVVTPSSPGASANGSYEESMKDYDYGYSYDEPESPMTPDMPAEDSALGGTANASSGLPSNVKIIYTARLELETTEFDTTVAKMQALVASLGGYFENSGINNYSSYRYADYTIRVPAENFDAFRTQVSALCQLRYTSTTAEDVSEYYYDTESRLITQQTKLARLQELLAQAEDMADIITIESAISETEYQIELLTGTLRHYDSLVDYSTVYISLSEVYELSEIEEPVIGFWAKLGNAFKNGTASFGKSVQRMLINFAYNWIGWLIFFVIAAVVIILIVKRVKHIKTRRIGFKHKNASATEEDAQK